MKLSNVLKILPKSLWIMTCNTGSCNGCDIEIMAALSPRYDIERFGIKLVATPKHADALIVTGPVTKFMRDKLLRVYNQMPDPKFVVALGACAAGGGVLQGCYGVMGGADKVIPVDLYVPGCPPRPEALIDGIVKLLSSIKGVENVG